MADLRGAGPVIMAAPLHVTAHAILRYQQRVAAVSLEQARAALSTPAIRKAAEFGATCVRLGTGHRVVIREFSVVTVQPAENYARQIKRRGLGRYGRKHRSHRREIEA